MKRSKLMAIGLVATMISLVAGVYIGLVARPREAAEPVIANSAIALLFASRFNDTDGKAQPLAQWRGKTLVINFWASWCPPCREEMPAFSRLQTKHAANGVQFVGIALDTVDNVVNFSKRQALSYPLLVADAEGTELTRQLGNASLALPYTVVLGPAGEVRLARLGRVSEQELDTLLTRRPAGE